MADAQDLAAPDPTSVVPVSIPDMVRAEAARQGVDPGLAVAVAHQESRFNPDAKSPKGALGVMQLMPGTARDMGVDRYDLTDNIKGGVGYLKSLLGQFKGDARLAVAAYNAGPNAVTRYGDVPPFAETQAYVDAVLGKGQGKPKAPAADPAAPDLSKPVQAVSDPGDAAAPVSVIKPPGVLDRLKSAVAAANQAMPAGNPDDPGLAGNLVQPIVDTTRALGHDIHRWVDAPPASGVVQKSVPGLSPADQRAGSVLGDLAGEAFNLTGIPEIYNALAVKPGTALMDRLPTPAGRTPAQQHQANQEIFWGGLQGLGGEGEGAGLAERTAAAAAEPVAASAKPAKPPPTPDPVAWAQDALSLDQHFDTHWSPQAVETLAQGAAKVPLPAAKDAMRPGDGSVVIAGSKTPATRGQTAFVQAWRTAFPDRPTPELQVRANELPAPGAWYVDVQGRLAQVPVTEPGAAGEPHPAAPPEAPAAPEEAPQTPQDAAEPDPATITPPEPAQPAGAPPEAAPAPVSATPALTNTPEQQEWLDAMSKPGEPAPAPIRPIPPEIDGALDRLIAGKAGDIGRGPRLTDALIAQGGLKDLGDEIPDLRASFGARGGRLVNKSKGMSLDHAAEWAQEHGFLGKPIESGEAAQPADLVAALGRDLLAGKGDGVYSRLTEQVGPTERQLMDDLASELDYHGIGLNQPKADIVAALRDAWSQREALDARDRLLAEGKEVPDELSHAAIYGMRVPKDGAEPVAEPEAEPVAAAVQDRRPGTDPGRTGALKLIDAGAPAQDVLEARTAGGGAVKPMTDNPVAGPVARAEPATPQPLPARMASETALIQRLRRASDTVLRQGRLHRSGADLEGQYSPASGVARMRNWGDLDVASHEIGHHLDQMAGSLYPGLRTAIDAHAAELRPLDYVKPDIDAYPQTGGYRPEAKAEGFAEFFRRYVTNPERAKAAAPKFYDAFEAALRQNGRGKRLLGDVKKIAADYQTRLAHPATDRLGGQIHPVADHSGPLGKWLQKAEKVGPVEAARATATAIYGDLIDSAAEFNRAQKGVQTVHWVNTGKALDLEGKANPLLLFRSVRMAGAEALANMWHGVRFVGERDPSGPSLRAALDKAYGSGPSTALGWKKTVRADFSTYLVASRLADEWKRFEAGKIARPPSRETRASVESVVAELEKAHPQFRDAASMFSDYAKAEMRLDVESGRLSQRMYDALDAERPFYAPLNRLREVGEPGGPATAGDNGGGGMGEGGEASIGGAYNRFGGSFRDFLDPVEVMMRRAMTGAAARRFNMGVRAMEGLIRQVGAGSAKLAERVPDHVLKPIDLEMDEILTKTAEKYGVAPEDLYDLLDAEGIDITPSDKLTFFRGAKDSAKAGENWVFGWENGKRFALQLPEGEGGRMMIEFMMGGSKELQQALTGLTAARALTATTRFGVTGAMAWGFANAFKDAIDVALKVPGAVPGITQVRGLLHVVGNTKTAQAYARTGRIKAGAFADIAEHTRVKPDPRMLNKRTALPRHALSLAAIARLVEVSEMATRIGVFAGRERMWAKRGLDPESAMLQASHDAAEYMPFDVTGRRTAFVRGWVPFVNAQIRGLDTWLKTAVPADPVAKWLRGEPLTRIDQDKLVASGNYALLAGAMTIASIALASHNKDNPKIRDMAPYRKATQWLFDADELGVPKDWQHWTGRVIALPKPYEHAAAGDVGERIAESQGPDGDLRALGDIPGDLWQTLGPPQTVTMLTPLYEAAKNRDWNGRPIIPEHLAGAGDPELKVNAYTSEFSKALSHQMGQISQEMFGVKTTFSPAMADHWITSLTATQGREALNVSNRWIAGDHAPASGPEDQFLLNRFVVNPTRGSKVGADFWARMGKDDGTYTAAVNDFNTLAADHRADAIARLQKLPPDQRDFVLAEKFGSLAAPGVPGGGSMLNPMVRAQHVTVAINAVRQMLRDDTAAGAAGPIKLTADQRRDADDTLSALEEGEQKNAMIAAGAPTYAHEKPYDMATLRHELTATSPALAQALDEQMAKLNVPPDGVVEQYWPQLRAVLRQLADQALPQAVEHQETRGKRGKYDELIRHNQALLAH